jgi:hypothetical protein
MPDADRFERSLRGSGWRSAYRLAAGGATSEQVTDRLMPAFARYLREQPKPDVPLRFEEAVVQALHRVRSDGDPSLSKGAIDDFHRLSRRLEIITVGCCHDDLARLAERAALRTYVALEERAACATETQVAERFAGELAWAVVDNRCLSRVRDGIMEATGRPAEAQGVWESELRRNVFSQAGRMTGNLLQGALRSKIRAPRRLTQRRETTLERLHEPLQVIGG